MHFYVSHENCHVGSGKNLRMNVHRMLKSHVGNWKFFNHFSPPIYGRNCGSFNSLQQYFLSMEQKKSIASQYTCQIVSRTKTPFNITHHNIKD